MIQGRKTVGRSITIAMLATAFWLPGPMVHAAGLGRLNVISPLGQPLNAEIEIVSLQAGEEEGLVARLAPPDAFREAGIEFNPALVTVRFAIERRGGRPMLRVRTTQPVNDPFLEMLVELQWTTGRLVREYTVLLDPPEYKRPQAIAAAPVAPVKPAAAPEPAAEAPTAQPAPEPARAPAPAPLEATPLPTVPAPAVEPAPAPAPAAEAQVEKPAPAEAEKPALEHVGEPATAEETKVLVKKGDTLSEIARQNLPPGANLNQMLIEVCARRQVLACNFAQRVALLDQDLCLFRGSRLADVLQRGLFCFRRGGLFHLRLGCWRGRRCWLNRGSRDGRQRRGFQRRGCRRACRFRRGLRRRRFGGGLRGRGRLDGRHGRSRDCLRPLVFRWVEKNRVLAHQPAGGPLQLDQHLEERIVDRLSGSHAQHGTAAAALDREPHRDERRIKLDAGLPERVGGSETRHQAFFLARLQGDNLDLGIERLAERQNHVQPAQPGRVDHRTGQPKRGRKHRNGY